MVKHRYSAAGSYSISVNVTDGNGGEGLTNKMVLIRVINKKQGKDADKGGEDDDNDRKEDDKGRKDDGKSG